MKKVSCRDQNRLIELVAYQRHRVRFIVSIWLSRNGLFQNGQRKISPLCEWAIEVVGFRPRVALGIDPDKFN